jgi:hypothetical protein
MQWQPRDSQISSNSTEYLARTTSAPGFQILEIMPATAPRAARGRTDATEAVGCADLAPRPTLLRLLRRLLPPPFAIQQHVQPAPRRKAGRWPTTPTLLAGTFWPRGLIWYRLLKSSNTAKRSSTKSLICCWPWHRLSLQFLVEPHHRGSEKEKKPPPIASSQ